MKLTFGDADTQVDSPTSKRLRLATDSVDFLADLRGKEKSADDDSPPWKFRLLFGGSSKDLSQQQHGDGDCRNAAAADDDDVDNTDAETDVTSDTATEPSSSDLEGRKDADDELMTQADEVEMKTYVPLSAAAALSYISDDDAADDVLDLFFFKPPSNRLNTANHRIACTHPSTVDTAATAPTMTDDDGGSQMVQTSSTLSSVTDHKCCTGSRELRTNAKLFGQEPDTVLSEFITDDGRRPRASTVVRVADESKVCNKDSVCSMNEASYLASSEIAVSVVGRELSVDDVTQDSDLVVDRLSRSHSRGLCYDSFCP